MSASNAEQERLPAAGAELGGQRILTGAIQGVVLAALSVTADAMDPALHSALFLALLYAPLVLLAGLGQMRRKTLLIWFGVAALVLAGLGAYEVLRRADTSDYVSENSIVALYVFSAAALYCAHHLVAAGDSARALIAPYESYFELSSQNAVRGALSIAFVGALWMLLFLGASLFDLVELRFLGELIRESWFAWFISPLAFAIAVHATDMRAGFVRGLRALGLTLLSWLLPVFTTIIVVFLLTLPFTSLEPLWRTRAAAAILLSAAAALLILVNAAYQDGDPPMPRWARWAATAASWALVPLVAIAAYAIVLRIGQYGLTPERVIASFVCLIAAFYALGYAAATILSERAFALIERVNVAAAASVVVAILLLLSPIADPARVSVDDQVRRLEEGIVAPDKFDFAFLRRDGARHGQAALARLAQSPNPAIASRAKKAIEASPEDLYAPSLGPDGAREPLAPGVDLRAAIVVEPRGAALPDDFLRAPEALGDDARRALATCRVIGRCTARTIDLDADNRAEILIDTTYNLLVFAKTAAGAWTYLGETSPLCGQDLGAALREGAIRGRDPVIPDLQIDARTYRIQPPPNC